MTARKPKPLKTANSLPKKAKSIVNKYALYEAAVQTPEQHSEMFALIHADITGRRAHILREDFCGTFMICCEWVKRNPKNQAIGIDLDSVPLDYGRTHHLKRLTVTQKKRLKLLQKNVLQPTAPRADIVVGCNFSFNIFKERTTLLKYLRAGLASLKREGVMILEMAGGPGMIETTREQKTIAAGDSEDPTEFTRAGIKRYTYIWQQKSFNPITHNGHYAIHFRLDNGTYLRDAFTYDWRLWTLPEIRDAMSHAGFKKTFVYWEVEDGPLTTLANTPEGRCQDYLCTDQGDNAYSWIAYVVGQR